MTKINIFTIDGNIGSGKSTLLNHLKKNFGDSSQIIFADEPVDEWNTIKDAAGVTMLEKFYKDQKTYSFSFQMMAYISRLHILKMIIRENPSAIIITERSLHTDRLVFAKMLFDTGLIEDVNYQIYLKWFDSFVQEYPISGVIYVKTQPEICFERIKKRSRTGESDIPVVYLTKCDEYHDGMILEMEQNMDIRILTLDGNPNIFHEPELINSWMSKIHYFIQ